MSDEERQDEPTTAMVVSVQRAMTPAETKAAWLDCLETAAGLYKSGLMPQSLRTPEAVAAVVLTGLELGMGAMEAVRSLYVVNQRVGMYAECMRARIYRAGGSITVEEHDDTHCILTGHRPGHPDATVSFGAEDARKAGLAGGNYGKYPKDMYLARATSRLARLLFPDVFGGTAYTPEELVPDPNPQPAALPDAPKVPTRAQRLANAGAAVANNLPQHSAPAEGSAAAPVGADAQAPAAPAEAPAPPVVVLWRRVLALVREALPLLPDPDVEALAKKIMPRVGQRAMEDPAGVYTDSSKFTPAVCEAAERMLDLHGLDPDWMPQSMPAEEVPSGK